MGSISTQQINGSCLHHVIVLIALLRFSMNLIHQMYARQRSMCAVIVVDADRSRSTNLGRDAYIHDHCLGYRHNYLLFYQLPNSNLFTHRMLFSREKPLVKSTAPGSIFYHIVIRSIIPKIPCRTFSLFILFCVFARSIYPISYNLIYLNTEEGLTTPLTRWVASFRYLCEGIAYIVWWILLLD